MNIRQDRRSYYIFLLLTLSSSVLTLLIGISMAWLNLQNTIESRTRDFDKLLVMLDSLYLTPLGHSNQTALQLIEEQMDKPAIAGGAPALNAVWKAAYRLRAEPAYLFFFNLASQRLDTYPSWVPAAGYDPRQRPWYRALEMTGPNNQLIGPYREYNSGEWMLSYTRKVQDDSGKLLGLLMADIPVQRLHERLLQGMLPIPVALQVLHHDTGAVITQFHPELVPEAGMSPATEPSWHTLWHGLSRQHLNADSKLDLHVYLPPAIFREAARNTLRLVILPMVLLFALSLLSLSVLILIFRSEQRLVARLLSGEQPESLHQWLSTWFSRDVLARAHLLRHEQQANREALLTDPLTGIQNRRAFDLDMANSQQQATPLTLMLIDVDHFKQVNDALGHQQGDRVLIAVARQLRQTMQPALSYRIGGDEFAVLTAERRASVLLEGVQRLQRALARLQPQAVSVSVGIACVDDSREPGLFELADASLYRSKQHGRNGWTLRSAHGAWYDSWQSEPFTAASETDSTPAAGPAADKSTPPGD